MPLMPRYQYEIEDLPGAPGSNYDPAANSAQVIKDPLTGSEVESQPKNPSVAWSDDFGQYLNGLTGANSATQTNIIEAQKDREYQTAERIAAQEYNTAEAVSAWERNELSAQRARDFELESDSTLYQRRMADMKAAGINPMLAATSGIPAGTLSGQAATSSAASVSPQSGSRASASGNSAAVVAAIIAALGKTISSAISNFGKMRFGNTGATI